MVLTVADLARAHEAFKDLIGLPLTDMWRYVGCQKFEFGEQKQFINRKGEAVTRADWGLVVSCNWRIVGPASFMLCSDHFNSEKGRQDSHATDFYRSLRQEPPVIHCVDVQADGGLKFSLSQAYTLAVEPIVKKDVDDENWRLMPPSEDSRGHLVLWGKLEWTGGPD